MSGQGWTLAPAAAKQHFPGPALGLAQPERMEVTHRANGGAGPGGSFSIVVSEHVHIDYMLFYYKLKNIG